jgi:hypothetical protein
MAAAVRRKITAFRAARRVLWRAIMKTLTLILVILVTAGSAQAQTVDEARQQMIAHTPPNLQLSPEWKPADATTLEQARARRNEGVAMTILGIGLEVTAAALYGYALTTGFVDAFRDPADRHNIDAYAYGAIGCGLLGLGVILAGVDMWIDGQSRLNHLRITPTLGGATAAFTF